MSSKILYITSVLPKLTLTFIYREIIALEKLGVEIDIVSMYRPDIENVSIEARPFLDRVLYLDQVRLYRRIFGILEVLFTRPLRLTKMLLLLFQAQPRGGLRGFMRLSYHFIDAVFLTHKIRNEDFAHIHAHFVAGPSSIAMFMSGLTGISFSFTMHGSQIYTDPLALAAKLERCRFAVSVTEYHRQYVLDTYGKSFNDKFHVVRCGLDMEQFSLHQRRRQADQPFRILGVGRLVELKGFEYLLRACAELKAKSLAFSCRIVGDGELRGALQELACDLDIEEDVRFEGAQGQSELAAYYADADVFCLPCVVGPDGGRDGLPIVLMEAMAWKLPIVSSQLVGIPELVQNYRHGILVAPKDIEGLANAFSYIHEHPEEVAGWGEAGRKRVADSFNVAVSAVELKDLFTAEAAD